MRRALRSNNIEFAYIGTSVGDLYRHDHTGVTGRPALLCIRDKFSPQTLSNGFASSDWPLKLLTGLQLIDGGAWLFAEDHQNEHTLTSADLEDVARAAGLDGPPAGNVRCSWPIRQYSNKNDESGNLDWLRSLRTANANAPDIARLLINALIELSEQVCNACGTLYVEQLSILISKDANAPTRCLTPVIHADEYYGLRESALVSLSEAGFDVNGGTVFYPTIAPHQLGQAGRMPPEEFNSRFASAPAYRAQHGEFIIYDGMAGKNGNLNLDHGTPHVSGDLAGYSSRLLVLMRHISPE